MVEGLKLVGEAIASQVDIDQIFVTDVSYLAIYQTLNCDKREISKKDMERISDLSTASPVLAVLKKSTPTLDIEVLRDKKFVMLDGIRDPGNLGTIIRTCDWFGIDHIVASDDSVDALNNKVLQSTMGSAFRVQVHYTDLREFLQTFAPWKSDFPVYAAVLGGQDLKSTLKKNLDKGCLVIGSESHGISEEVQRLCSHKITIAGSGRAESLNAAISAAIILHEWCG